MPQIIEEPYLRPSDIKVGRAGNFPREASSSITNHNLLSSLIPISSNWHNANSVRHAIMLLVSCLELGFVARNNHASEPDVTF